MTTRHLRAVTILVASLAAPAWAFHTVFDFTVDRFSVDGNTQGAFGGIVDWIDDFPGSSTSNWYTPFGTSSVSGGRLHVKSPGVHFPGPDGTSIDLTEVASAWPTRGVMKGAGSFTATAVFDPVIPPDGHFYHFTLYTFGGGQFFNENFGLDIHTLGGQTRIEQHLVIIDIANGIYQTVQVAGQTILPTDVTGQIHFRLSYDDVAATISGAFSLDGGQTFQAPFASASIFTQGRNSGQFLLGADPHVTGEPPGTTTTTTSASTTTTTTIPPAFGACLRTDCRTAPRGTLNYRDSTGRLSWSWRYGSAASPSELGDPTSAGGTRYVLCLRDATTLLYSGEVAPGGTCGGKPCWRALPGLGFGYRGVKGAPGVGTLKVISGPKPAVEASAATGGLPGSLPATAPLTVQVEADTGACWSTTFDAGQLIQSTTRIRGKL
jgi:hypothetical protein